jgi:hypothetical protein
MSSADIRSHLTQAVRLDLIGPDPDDSQISETLPVAPSRWYLTGFLVPLDAPPSQKHDQDDTQGELGFGEPATAADEDDDSNDEPPAAAADSSLRPSVSACLCKPMRPNCE